jgi:hypothetical protein
LGSGSGAVLSGPWDFQGLAPELDPEKGVSELLQSEVPMPEKSDLEWSNLFAGRLIEQQHAFDRMEKSFIAFRTRINTVFAIAAAVIGLSAWGIISAAWSLQRELGKNDAAIANQTSAMEKIEKRFDEMKSLGDKLDRVSEGLARIQGRLDAPNAKPGP